MRLFRSSAYLPNIMVVWRVAASAEACITRLHIALLCSPVFLLLHSGRGLEYRQNAWVIIQEQIPALPDINITAVHLEHIGLQENR